MAAYGNKKELSKYAKDQALRGSHQRNYTPAYVADAVARCAWLGKDFRPWFVSPPAERLDVDKVWVGFEVETGYPTSDARRTAMEYLQRTTHRWCFDGEGSGRYPVEFTFYPVHLDQIGTCNAGPKRIVKMAKMAGMKPAPHQPYDLIGTHLNISTPQSRRNRTTRGVNIINSALHNADPVLRNRLFGRSNLYVGLRPQGFYYEFKLFNTTYDEDQLERYMHVARSFVRIVEGCENNNYTTEAHIRDHLLALDREVAVIKAEQDKKKAARTARILKKAAKQTPQIEIAVAA